MNVNKLPFPASITPGMPRREVAQQFYKRVIEMGEWARKCYLRDCAIAGTKPDADELARLDENLAICRAELSRHT